MNIPADLKYLPSHEWCRVEEGVATLGITDFAQDQLGDVVYVELPAAGTVFQQAGQVFGTIESVKAASDLYTPVAGEVVEVHEALEDELEKVNDDPYGDGWMIKIKLSNPADLDGALDAAGYQKVVEAES